MVQTKREIEALLTSAGLRPKRRFGQNFLIDGNLMRILVASADLAPSDVVVSLNGAKLYVTNEGNDDVSAG